MNKHLALGVLLLISLDTYSQPKPILQWQKCFGGSSTDMAHSITKTTDGNFVIVGETYSNDGDVITDPGDTLNVWVFKINAAGDLLWQKSYGGTEFDAGKFVTATPDGGCIVIANAASNDGDVTGYKGGSDIWVIKLDRNGNIEWNKCYGGSNTEHAGSIRTTADGGYVFIGRTSSNDGDVTGNKGDYDVWLVKLDATGIIQWQKCYGSANADYGEDVQPLIDGDYLITVNTYGSGGDFPVNGPNPWRFIARLDQSGDIVKTFLLEAGSKMNSAMYPVDGNKDVLVASNYMNCQNHPGSTSLHVTRMVDSGHIWHSELPAYYVTCNENSTPRKYEVAGAGSLAPFGMGYCVAGVTDVTIENNAKGWDDAFIGYFSLTDTLGRLRFGGSGLDGFNALAAIDEDNLIAVGYTTSNNGDVSGNHGLYDVWVVRLTKSNAIRGTVFRDINSNGIRDANEPLVPDVLVKSTKPDYEVSSTAYNGIFNNAVDTGTYATTLVNVPQYYTVSPLSQSSSFSNYGNTDSFSFALQPMPGKRDYGISIAGITPVRPGFEHRFQIAYKNSGTDTLNNKPVTCFMDRRLHFVSASTTPESVNGQTITWNIETLLPNETGHITVTCRAEAPPGLNNGDIVENHAITDTTGDVYMQDNEATMREVVVGSYDPNDKMEANGDLISPEFIHLGKPLTYTIRFQNTGTDTAFTVVIRDTLDANLNWASLEMISASHPYTLTIEDGNKLKWTFADILLVDSNRNEPASHGYITYRIKPQTGLHLGDVIRNGASIYFDFNLPVHTNVTESTIKPEPPPRPAISGLQTVYCSNEGTRRIKITNLPAGGAGITVQVTIDEMPVTVGADSTVSINTTTLGAGTHTVSVVYGNITASRTHTGSFSITENVAPAVDLTANTTTVTDLSTPVILTASNTTGGGTTPLYTFARDRDFTSIVQAESAQNSCGIDPATLSMGENRFYVRLKTSAPCAVVNTVTDSILLVRNEVTGIIDPDMPGQVITISPNPFRNIITIRGLNLVKSYTLTLYNTHGRQVYQTRVNNRSTFTLRDRYRAGGVYWLSIYDEKRKKLLGTMKLIRE